MSLLSKIEGWASTGLDRMQEICDYLAEVCVILEDILTAIEQQNKGIKKGPKRTKEEA